MISLCRKRFLRTFGFSLIEMMTVLVLLAMMIGIAIPAVSNIGRFRATSEMGKFNAFLRSTLMKSIRNNVYVRVVIDFENSSYWAEESKSPFFLMTSSETEVLNEEREKLKEDLESFTDPFERREGGASGAGNFFQMMEAKQDDALVDDFYHWENFVPSQRDVKEIITPEFQTVSKKKQLPEGIKWKAFFSYHTPEIMRYADIELEKENEEEKVMFVHIFPQGRIEPFYLAVGDDDSEEPIAYIESDFFMNTKISPGGFEENVEDIRKIFEDRDEEGK